MDKILHKLRQIIKEPETLKTVFVIDDNRSYALAICDLLDLWENIDHELIIVSNQNDLKKTVNLIMKSSVDIVLLDEGMNTVSGTEIYNELKHTDFKGEIISTSSGACPPYTNHHFKEKELLRESSIAMNRFVDFMNYHI